jgi:hypothetical protein
VGKGERQVTQNDEKQDASIFTSENSNLPTGILTSEKSKAKRILTSENSRPKKLTVIDLDKGRITGTREFSLVKNPPAGKSTRGRKKKESDLPDFGDYHYWKTGSKNGFALEYKPPIRNEKGEIIDYDYSYIGFWHRDDWQRVQRTADPEKIKEQIRTVIKAKRLISAHRRRSIGRTGSKRR